MPVGGTQGSRGNGTENEQWRGMSGWALQGVSVIGVFHLSIRVAIGGF